MSTDLTPKLQQIQSQDPPQWAMEVAKRIRKETLAGTVAEIFDARAARIIAAACAEQLEKLTYGAAEIAYDIG